MNENGYIRKIDELGRIVIPKELRLRLKIQEGENIFINCVDKNIKLTKHSYVINNENFIKKIGDVFHLIFNYNIIITDLEKMIYSSKYYDDINLNNALDDVINIKNNKKTNKLIINNEITINGNIILEPIIVSSSNIGMIIIYSTKEEDLSKYSKFISSIIAAHIEVT